ncbi:RcnB family protein [Caballeronia sp. BR00000012568055]|jgi:Ni/Co efflux regulator RcnB|uniref:RcnB family protein n=1 Tax=Caballeronia sp. BR00000012568055 TaxID=2918761 RepID=UPI0023F91457|nr:RcnB family protein [Caballeronia sp. BR00000012568055]
MKKSRIVAALLCASMGLAATASFAQPAPGGPDQYHGDQRGPGDQHGPNDHGGPGPQGHGPAMNMNDHQPPHGPDHADNGPHHPDWRKGQRLSNDYRDHQYVVDDWHDHGLRQPPRGYQWVGVGGDYLLVAVASGIISQVIFSQ